MLNFDIVPEGTYKFLPSGMRVIFRNGAWRNAPVIGTTSSNPGNGSGEENPSAPTPSSSDRMDLKNLVTQGDLDLSVCQTYRLDNSTPTEKNIRLLNLPEGRAMSIVLEVEGKEGTLGFPPEISWPKGYPELVEGTNMVLIYYNGSTLMGL